MSYRFISIFGDLVLIAIIFATIFIMVPLLAMSSSKDAELRKTGDCAQFRTQNIGDIPARCLIEYLPQAGKTLDK